MTMNVLFVSHRKKQCGVHEFGKNIGDTIKSSSLYNFIYVECESLDELDAAISKHSPGVIIYNHHPSTMSWITKKIIHTRYKALNRHIKLPQVGIMHEVTQQKADGATDYLFDYYIAPDPTLLLNNPIVFKTGRLVPSYINSFPIPEVPVIGSFGFPTPNKGFEELVKAVQNEFDSAVIRFNIPAADFDSNSGAVAKQLVAACKQLIHKPGVQLEVSHDFLTKQGILDFLAGNTLNVFLYKDKAGRGISSTVDYALAVDRPLAVSDSTMFRHLHSLKPSVVYGHSTFTQIIENGIGPLAKLKNEWNGPNLTWNYERIVERVLIKEQQKKNVIRDGFLRKAKNEIRNILGMRKKTFSWLRNTEVISEDDVTVDTSQSYTPVLLPPGQTLNRILDNAARKLYEPAIKKLTELVPLTMAKKIAEANVQQAFVFDTVYRYTKNYASPKILCVGSYEDTAAMSLQRLGFQLEEIDPVVNYYLQEYYTKPSTIKNSYDIILSTSVIEHDPDDESFVTCITGLLAPGGVAVITCDYNDAWKKGDPKPGMIERFYTQNDLKNRLLPLMKDCSLVDTPQWECPNPDFNYLGKFQYTFASMVVKKSATQL